MKHLVILLILLQCLSCDKTPPPNQPDSSYWGEAQVERNGKLWTGLPYAFVNINHGKGLEIIIDSLVSNYYRKESLSFSKVPFLPGTYPLVNTFPQTDDGLVGAYFFVLDYDVTLGNYKVLEADSSSFITVIAYDTLTKELKGEFDITCIVDHRPYTYPDTIRFRNGHFHTKVIPK